GAIAASTPSYDICAVLSRVDAEDRVFNLTQGYRRVARPEMSAEQSISRLSVPLHPTCFSLAAGERLRLSISAACFPAYPINPGTGQSLSESRLIDAQIITVTLTFGADSGSVLKLPVMRTCA
ncbi:MAG: CocE/NonD family hydrolase C-terminal non-catalytic domain-containing protein, partial [Cyanobacteria bacterium J06650_10]